MTIAVSLIGLDDSLHQLMPDNVLRREIGKCNALHVFQNLDAFLRPDSWPEGRSICVMSPVTTAREPNPILVRNIFICATLVFCASSSMTKESLSDRPRINANGATSMTFFSISRPTCSVTEHVVERVIHRPKIRIDLLRHISGKKPEALTSLHCRSNQHNSPNVLILQRINRTGYCQVGFTGTSRTNAESQVDACEYYSCRLFDLRRAHEPVSVLSGSLQRHHRRHQIRHIACLRLVVVHNGLLQANMDPLRIEPFMVSHIEKRMDNVGTDLSGTGIPRDAESISAIGNFNIEAAFNLA